MFHLVCNCNHCNHSLLVGALEKKYPWVISAIEDALSDNPKQYFSEHSFTIMRGKVILSGKEDWGPSRQGQEKGGASEGSIHNSHLIDFLKIPSVCLTQ